MHRSNCIICNTRVIAHTSWCSAHLGLALSLSLICLYRFPVYKHRLVFTASSAIFSPLVTAYTSHYNIHVWKLGRNHKSYFCVWLFFWQLLLTITISYPFPCLMLISLSCISILPPYRHCCSPYICHLGTIYFTNRAANFTFQFSWVLFHVSNVAVTWILRIQVEFLFTGTPFFLCSFPYDFDFFFLGAVPTSVDLASCLCLFACLPVQIKKKV